MNPEIKAKWLTALRSGEYQQTKGVLTDECGYCCIGILGVVQGIDLHNNEEGLSSWWLGESNMAGLTMLDADKLADMNDKGKSFSEIANYIERNIP